MTWPALAGHADLDRVSAHPKADAPAIGIIIDDLGHRLSEGLRAVRLPGAVACAFLPHSPHVRQLAQDAHSRNKEVMLHLPMEAVDQQHAPGNGALTLNMTQTEFVRTLEHDLASVPHVQGINNHMGSLLTRHPGHMLWLMQALNRRKELFFVDSRTSAASVAQMVAQENGVPSVARNVFLDAAREPEAIRAEFARLIDTARRDGTALAIGHPYPETLAVLERELPRLQRTGVRLVAISELIRLQRERVPLWRASLSP